ncbi:MULTISPECIES: hypothetical protein [unclassified Sulfitobacter]|uniref:hypothetical protein n=1 Tax=unclassified Sulfitobacter TaxID=196795 RepID=UPI0023E2A9F0|nr:MULTISPECIES: hypothetical protein [unclassified Sulfitobacter]MDF3383409.1 hypothetical protein [Sulfitobacter sp. Ks11]MDF3386827.1 hypothetical protein [Sulfitobacter sp. M85]MDF3390247.1 hypothetical protein [Sulfitobacter sp. Ks16]MDF3400884.1 hypothetical protein [Sulfitobacter sp. KE39]MDF3404305.1 hypothetical protein [Sulfitobacter sp. Ks35]
MTTYIELEGIEPMKLKEIAGDPEAHAALNSSYRDAEACRRVLLCKQEAQEAVRGMSTSEAITIALAFGRDDLLPMSHRDFRSAWRRIDNRQRRLVDIAARAKWATQYESPACNG